MIAHLVYKKCVEAINKKQFIKRESSNDKEFHFQNWFIKRLDEAKLNYDNPGRNSYPDFTLVDYTDGFELKGLAYPGRVNDYDSNSQVPKGILNGRSIYYVFGRYPSKPDGNEFPVLDLVICHGSFLNADSAYVHKNKSAKGFGSYGDIMIRDRKMYVAPTPFSLVDGLAHQLTLIVPESEKESLASDAELVQVGELTRVETSELLVSYSFDLTNNDLNVKKVPNPTSGKEHKFIALRMVNSPSSPIKMRNLEEVIESLDDINDE